MEGGREGIHCTVFCLPVLTIYVVCTTDVSGNVTFILQIKVECPCFARRFVQFNSVLLSILAMSKNLKRTSVSPHKSLV